MNLKLFSWRKYAAVVLIDDDMEVYFAVVFVYTFFFVFYSFSNLLWLTPSSAAFDVCINYDASDLLGLRTSPHASSSYEYIIIYIILSSATTLRRSRNQSSFISSRLHTTSHNTSYSSQRVTVRGDDKYRFKKKINTDFVLKSNNACNPIVS